MSSFRERLAPRALAVALVACAGCRETDVFQTPLVLSPPERCIDPAMAGPPDGFDQFIVDVLEFTGQVEPAGRTSCAPCARGEVDCPLVSRACVCAGPRVAGDEIREALSGVALRDLDPGRSYCVRVVGARTRHGQGEGTGPAVPCDAPVVCAPGEIPGEDLGICALSDVESLSRSETPILIDDASCAPCDGPDVICRAFLNLTSCVGFGE